MDRAHGRYRGVEGATAFDFADGGVPFLQRALREDGVPELLTTLVLKAECRWIYEKSQRRCCGKLRKRRPMRLRKLCG